ncbi:unnamed protein product, partial [Arabidopsis halleri]
MFFSQILTVISHLINDQTVRIINTFSSWAGKVLYICKST